MNFGSSLRNIRKRKNLSQKSLSEITGIPQTTISDWERGRSYPKIIQVQKIARVLEIDIKELLDSA